MANTRDLRRRIRSVKNTSQITKAMQMVSATKMRRAQSQAMSGRPYSATILKMLLTLLAKIDPQSNLLFQPNQSKKVGVLLLTSDKGLCGSLNSSLFRFLTANKIVSDDKEIVFYTIGRKGREFIARTGQNLIADFENSEQVKFDFIVQVRKFLLESFQANEIGEVYLLYPHFYSTLKQEPRLLKILPIGNELLDELRKIEAEAHSEGAPEEGEFLFEPNEKEILDYISIHLLDIMVYQAMLETKASEHSARMIAMQNATNNALDLVDDLTLTYNGLRQEGITKELLEIVSAGAALE